MNMNVLNLKKNKWLIAGVVVIILLLLFSKEIENQQMFIYLGGIAILLYFTRKKTTTIDDGYKATKYINTMENKNFGVQWTFDNPTIETYGTWFIIRGESTPTFIVDEFGNLKTRTARDVYSVKSSLETSEIIKKMQMKTIQLNELREKLRKEGILLQENE